MNIGGFQIKRREDDNPCCRFKSCLCFDLRMGTFLGGLVMLISTLGAWVMVVLDLAAWINDDFEIPNSYYTWWRQPFWKGFFTCDIIMIGTHLVLVVASIVLIVAILRPGTFVLYLLYPIVRAWWIICTLHTLTELGVSVYIYSFFGLAGWRLAYLIFCNMFYILRFVCSVGFIIVAHSYSCEIFDELHMPTHNEDYENDYQYEAGFSVSSHPPTFTFE